MDQKIGSWNVSSLKGIIGTGLRKLELKNTGSEL